MNQHPRSLDEAVAWLNTGELEEVVMRPNQMDTWMPLGELLITDKFQLTHYRRKPRVPRMIKARIGECGRALGLSWSDAEPEFHAQTGLTTFREVVELPPLTDEECFAIWRDFRSQPQGTLAVRHIYAKLKELGRAQ